MPNPPVLVMAEPSVAALLEAARRCARGGAPRSVLLLHLSAAQGVQPHHLRVARAILSHVAQRLEGEVLRLADGDLALICRFRPEAADPIGPDGPGPDGLPAVLDRLFATVTPTEGRLYTRWQLPAETESLQAALLSRPPSGLAPTIESPAPDPLEKMASVMDVDTMPIALRRRTAMRLHLADGSRRLRPYFQEVTAALDVAESSAHAPSQTDPFVARHLAARLDRRMLETLAGQIAHAADPWRAIPAALHVNLALPGILSDPCAALAGLCRDRGGRLGVELAIAEACAAPAQFEAARARLDQLGATLILDGFTPEAFATVRPAGLGASLIKLEWEPGLTRLAGLARGRLMEALREVGAAKVVLARAETEAALAWGLGHGITAFQGRHVDAMLAAGRLSICRFAAGCTLRQCIDRAAGAEPAGRTGCLDHTVLDASAVRDFVLNV